MSLWYTRCSNYPTESSAHDGMPFVTWLVVRVDVALGLNTFFFFFFLCMCFPYSKKKRKKSEAFFFFFPAQAITALLGSSRLLPWQLPVNIPAEFFLSAGERAPLFSATDKSIGHSWRKCKGRREGRRALPYLHMLEVMVQSDLTDLDASLQSGRGSERARIIVDQSVVQCSS